MSKLTKIIDASRKQTQQQPPELSSGNPGGQLKSTSVLGQIIDQTKQPGDGSSTAWAAQVKPQWVSFPSISPLPGVRDTRMVQDEMDRLDGVIQNLRSQQKALNGQAVRLTQSALGTNNVSGTGPNRQWMDQDQAQALRSQAEEMERQIAQLENNRAGLQEEWNQADQRQFERLRQTPDFQTAVEKAMSAGYGQSVQSLKPSHRDVKNAMLYFQATAKGDEALAEAAKSGADIALNRMNDAQRERLAYYVGIEDYDGAADYLNRIAPALNQAQLEQTGQRLAEWGQEHPIQGALTNITSWPLNIPAYFDNAGQAVENLITGQNRRSTSLTPYVGAQIGAKTGEGVQEAARSAAAQTFGSETAGDVAAFLTGAGLSIGQNVSQIALLGPASLAGMSMSAAGGAAAEALDRGATPEQAFLIGTAGGAIEALTEKIPLDNLFRLAKDGGGRGLKATVFELLKQMGTEASEETISEIANAIVDAAVMGDSSEFQSRVRELQGAGLSKAKAKQRAYEEFLFNVALAGAGGAVSGGVMSGGAMALGRLGKNADINAAIDRAYQTMGEGGMFSQESRMAMEDARYRLGRSTQELGNATRPVRIIGDDGTVQNAQESQPAKGPADGVIPPVGEQGTITPSRGQNAVQGIQRAAEEQNNTASTETAHAINKNGPPAAVDAAQSAFPDHTSEASSGRAQPLNQNAPQTEAEVKTRTDQIKDTVRQLRESFAQGQITEEAFDGALDLIEEQTGLEGLDISDVLMRSSKGGAYHEADEFGRTAAPDGQQLSGGGPGRAVGQGAGGQAGGVAESGPRGSADVGRAALDRQNTGRALQLEEVSSRELGLSNGTDGRTVRVLPESAWDGALRETARKVRRETGLGVRFVLGGIQVTGSDGAVHKVRGAYSQDGIIVQADHLRVSPAQIADHEIFHSYADRDPELIQAVEQTIVERYGPEGLRSILETYAKNLRGIVDIPEDGTDHDFEQAYADIKNEVFADAFAGINAFEVNAGQYQGAVLDTLEGRDTAEQVQSRENAQATDRRTGPPEQYSIDYDQNNRPFVKERSGHTIRPSQMESHRSGMPVSSESGTDNITNPHEGTGDRNSASVSTDNIAQTGASVKGGGFMLPTGKQGTVELPKAGDAMAPARELSEAGGIESGEARRQTQFSPQAETGPEDSTATRYSVDDEDGDVFDPGSSENERIPDGLELPTLKDKLEHGGTPPDPSDPPKPPKKKPSKPITESKPIIAKRELKQTILSLFSIPEGMRAELGAEVDRLADRMLRNGGLSQADRDAFFDRMYESGVMELEVEEHQRTGRDALKGKKIYVPSSVKSEFGGSTEWNEFRKRAFAAGILLTNNQGDSGIDTLNAELSQTLPGLFDPEETDNRAILERFVQAAEEGQAEKMSLSEYIAMLAGQGSVSEDEILDNLERQMDWALRTFVEKTNLELRLRDRTGIKLAQQRDEFVRQNEARRMRGIQQQAAEREQRRETARQKREAKDLREMQNRTLKQLQWLKKNMDRAPSELKEAFGEVLGDLDIYAVGAAKATRWNKKHGATWQDLAQMYKDAKENDPNFLPSKELEKIVARIDGAKVGDLDANALQDLYKAAVGLRTEFENRKQIVHDKMRRQVGEVYHDSQQELESAPGAGKFKDGGMDKLLNLSQLSPMNVMQRMAGWNPDSTFYSMAKQLEQGERDIRAYTVEANRQLADFLNEYEDWVKKSDGQGKDAIWYEIEVPDLVEYGQGHKPILGDTVKVYMTPAQKVHMYLESQGVDNLRHMEGGRTFVNKELYAAGKRQEALAQGTTVRLAPETVKRLVSDLTPEEQAMARALERYYNQFAKDKINKVSNDLYGYDKAMGTYYAPIYTNANYNTLELGVFDDTAEGVGRLKSRVYSKTPSYNLSALDAFERHVEQTARFVGMSIPYRNWEVLLNWEEKEGIHPPIPFRQVVTNCWGEAGVDYIQDTIQALQGSKKPPRGDSVSTLTDQLFSNYISAVFGANPSIVFKQMGSIPMAAAWLELKNFPSPAQISRIDREFIAKYTQELDWRTMGYSMPETKQLKDNPNWSQTNKFTSFVFGGDAITAMDGWAASVLWPWAENKVRRDNPELKPGTQEQIDSGTDPFYQKVAEEFNNAVARSQSTSDEMHQGALRKSTNPVARAFTMFKSDSSQLYNALRQMAGEAAYYKRVEDDENAKKARRKLGAALLAAIGGYIWAESIEFLMNLWKRQGKRYRDGEGKLTGQSVAGEMVNGLVGDLASVVPGGEELVEILGNIATGDTWYGINAPGLEQLVDVLDLILVKSRGGLQVLQGAADVAKNGGDVGVYLRRHGSDIAGGIKEAAAAAATYLPGLPVNNLEAYMLGTVRWVSPELAAAYEDALAAANKNRLSGLSGEALTQRVETLLDVRGVDPGENGTAAISALYEAGHRGAVPPDTPGSVRVKEDSRKLSAYQQQVYDRVWSGTIGNAIGELTESDAFQAADEETREQMLKSLYSWAGEKAQSVLFDDYEASDLAGRADDITKAGASVAQWAAWQGQLGALSRAAEVEDRNVKQSEKFALLQEQEWPDEVKVAAAGTILGTKLKTESGNPTQYAKLLAAVKAGVDVDTWLASKVLEPEEDQIRVSNVQQWRAVVDAAGSVKEQKAALLSVMSDSVRMKYEIADSFGVKPEAWVRLKEALPKFDEDENGSYSGKEIENAIDALGGNGALLAPWDKDPLRLSQEEKAALWQMFTGSTNGKSNPFSRSVGREAVAALEKAKEEAKQTP